MLNSRSSRIVSVLFIAILVQIFLFASTSVINTALAGSGGSDSDNGGGGGNDDSESFNREVVRLESQLQFTNGNVFPSGNIGLEVGGGGGETRFYSNGDGTYNTITYPRNDDNNDSNNNSSPSNTYYGCPSGTTQIGSSCCPNQYVKTTTTGSGKGQSTTRSCNPPPPTPPTASISQSKATTVLGETFTVSFGRNGGGAATSCVLQRENSQVSSNGGSVSNFSDTLSTVGTYTYRARCSGPGGASGWASLDHNVIIPPPTVSLTADDYTVPYNTSTNLDWTSENTVSCTASGVWSGSRATDGSESSGNITDPSTYFLQCLGDNGESTSPAVVNIDIEYGVGGEIEVTPTVTRKESPVTVTWNTGTSDPANCQIQTGSIILQSPLTTTTGSLTHIIQGETIFTLNCENNHNNAEATVKVLPEFQET